MAKINPTRGLRLPTGEQTRDRIAAPDEAAKLIAALAPLDKAALGLALYAGLRRGELLALDWRYVDLEARTLRVEQAWDQGTHQAIAPKSKKGRRTIPITERLAALLSDHRTLMNQPTEGLLFPGQRDQTRPYNPSAIRNRMNKAWKEAELQPIGFHEARHTFAALMIAAGVNAKTLSTYMGHASITITFDRYGHLMPGNEAEARKLVDAYLARF